MQTQLQRDLKALRLKQRGQRSRLTLLQSPLKTLKYFMMESMHHVHNAALLLYRHWFLSTLVLSMIGALVVLRSLHGPHEHVCTKVATKEKKIYIYTHTIFFLYSRHTVYPHVVRARRCRSGVGCARRVEQCRSRHRSAHICSLLGSVHRQGDPRRHRVQFNRFPHHWGGCVSLPSRRQVLAGCSDHILEHFEQGAI